MILPFCPVDLGVRLVEKAVDVYRIGAEDIVSRWFFGGTELDCMLWFSERGTIVRFQMNIHGQIVDLSSAESSGETLQTGYISEVETELGSGGLVERIVYDTQVNCAAVRSAIEVVRHAPALRSDWQVAVVRSLEAAAGRARGLATG